MQVTANIATHLFDPVVLQDMGLMLLKNGKSVADTLETWAHREQPQLALLMPAPLPALIAASNFSCCMILGRWPETINIFPNHPVPSPEWLKTAEPHHLKGRVANLDAGRFTLAAKQLQKLAQSGSSREQDEIARSITYLQDLAATVTGAAIATPYDTASSKIREGLLALSLNNSSKVHDVVQRSLQIFLPGALAPMGSGKDTIQQSQFKTDLAFMLVRRDDSWTRDVARFGWADSSPQGGFDWLLFKYREVSKADLSAIFDAVKLLMTTNGGSFALTIEAADGISLETGEARAEANRKIAAMIVEHILPPGTMGQGRTSIEDKVSTAVHMHCLEAWDVAHTRRNLVSYESFTHDLGVEAKMGDYHVTDDLSTVMPQWLASRRNRAPLSAEDMEGQEGTAMEEPTTPARVQF